MSQSRKRFTLLASCTIAIVLLLASGMAELVVRIIGGSPAALLYFGSFDDHQTDWHVRYGVTEGKFRVNCANPSIAARRKIAVIGDSYVFGQGVPDCQDLVSQIGKQMPDAAFTNLGMIGIGVEQYQLVVRDLLSRDYTDVIVLFYGNDISEVVERKSVFSALADASSALSLIRKINFMLTVRAFKNDPSNWEGGDAEDPIFNNSRLILRSDPRYFLSVADPGEQKIRVFSEKFRVLIEQISRSVPREHIWIAMVPEASTVSEQTRLFQASIGAELPKFGFPGKGYQTVQSLAKTEGVQFIDLFPSFSQRGSDLYFPHDFHWSPSGHALAAQLTSEALIESK